MWGRETRNVGCGDVVVGCGDDVDNVEGEKR